MIYRLLKPYFLKRFLAEQNKANTDELVRFVGIDSTGKKWYRPKEDINLPVQRLREQEKYLNLLAAKISPESLNIICEEILKQTESAVKGDKKSWAKIASLVNQIQLRDSWIYAPDLILHVCASQLIREDEEVNPKEIDKEIHQSKVEQLDKECEMNSEFFFLLSDIRELSDLLNPSERTWKEYKKTYLNQLKVHEESMKIYS